MGEGNGAMREWCEKWKKNDTIGKKEMVRWKNGAIDKEEIVRWENGVIN